MNDTHEKRRPSFKGLWIAILIILILVVGWHLLLPVLGISLAITAGAWGAIVTTVAAVCIAIVLFFMLTGVGIIILGLLALIWGLIAVVLFPIVFPIVAPLIVIVWFIAFLVRRKN